jgi:branched-chain amino acid aminotransferase
MDHTASYRGKISGAYANSSFVKTDANRSGFDEALVLTNEGHVSEGSAMNVFIVKDGIAITPPVTENILEGITRRTAIELLGKELNMQVIERPIDRTEVYLCDEIFFTGTAAQITVITKVDHRPIGDGQMGPTGSRLRQIFDDTVRGKFLQYKEWNIPVY